MIVALLDQKVLRLFSCMVRERTLKLLAAFAYFSLALVTHQIITPDGAETKAHRVATDVMLTIHCSLL